MRKFQFWIYSFVTCDKIHFDDQHIQKWLQNKDRDHWFYVDLPAAAKVHSSNGCAVTFRKHSDSGIFQFIIFKPKIVHKYKWFQCIAHNPEATSWRRKWCSLSLCRTRRYARSYCSERIFGNSWIRRQYIWNKVTSHFEFFLFKNNKKTMYIFVYVAKKQFEAYKIQAKYVCFLSTRKVLSKSVVQISIHC